MKDIIMRILFVLGIIIILVVLAIGIVRIVPKVFNSLATVGGGLSGLTNKEQLIISTSTDELNSGDDFFVSWEHKNKSEGSVGIYSITHNCVNDVSLEIIGSTDSKTLICNAPFSIGPDPASVKLRPTLSKDNTLRDVDIIVKYVERNTTVPKASGEKIVTIRNTDGAGTLAGSRTDYQDLNNGDGTVEITTTDFNDENTNPINPNPTTPSISNPAPTPADLQISNISSNNNVLIFTVSNIGGRPSGVWSFTYTIPTNGVEVLNGGSQISLRPGERLQYTINLNNINTNGGVVTININPTRSISESNYSNNIASANIGSANGGGDYGYNNGDDADLVITDMYLEDDRVDVDDEVVLYFTVKNEGGEDTGRWEYEISLPTDPRQTFTDRETDLRPGQSRSFRLEFDGLREGNNQDIDLEVDSEDDVDEENERNNKESVEIDIRD